MKLEEFPTKPCQDMTQFIDTVGMKLNFSNTTHFFIILNVHSTNLSVLFSDRDHGRMIKVPEVKTVRMLVR